MSSQLLERSTTAAPPMVTDPRQLRQLRAGSILQAPARATVTGRLIAAYVLLMPLVAGLPRGKVVPFLRLSEVLQVGVTGAAVAYVATRVRQGDRWTLAIRPVDWCMFGVALAGSVLPVVSAVARNEPLGLLAILGAFPLAKYFALYILARLAIRSVADVTTVLLAAVVSGTVIALLAIAEGLGIGPTGEVTRSLVDPDRTGAIVDGRAKTLLGSAISTGAVLAICSSISFGFAVVRRNLWWVAVTGLLLFGVLASGQISTYIAVGLVLSVTAWHHRVVLRAMAFGVPLALAAGVVMTPIIQARLADSTSFSIIPQSWQIRWVNVTEIYWPSIADGGYLIGVSPNTILEPPDTWRTEVFLESGYLWALWVGGLPLLIGFVALLVVGWRSLNVEPTDPVHEVARTTARATIAFMIVLNLIDPHISLRGGADLFYVLLPVALAFTPLSVPSPRRHHLLGLVRPFNDRPLSPTARLQIGEIGGPLLRSSGWASVSPGHGIDRGIDIQVRDGDRTIGEARVYFDSRGTRMDGIMFHPVRAVDDRAHALVWRAIALCAGSLRLHSLLMPSGSNGLVELNAREIETLARQADRLERNRHAQGLEGSRVVPRSSDLVPVGVRLAPHAGISRTRRLIDVVVAGSALVAFAPFAAVIVLLIRRSSPGPALFRQMRLGRGGLPFQILKFRTMDNRVGPDLHRESIETSLAAGEPDGKIDDDPRITRIGGFLRRWSLDEVPQLYNVLQGDMTLVGPRPSLLWETSLFAPETRRRLTLTPGVAGLWQASGRGDLSTEEMLALDLEYAESASLLGDAKLFGRTAVAVVTRRGAR